MFLEVGQIKC